EAVDAICAIPDITGDGSMEMVVGGRNGKLTSYSGGLSSVTLNANFIADETFGFTPFEVNFSDLSNASVTGWEWDFDNDGVIDSYEQNPTFTYDDFGIYTVSLTVSDGSDTDTEIKIDYIEAQYTGIEINEYLLDVKISPNPMISGTRISFTLLSNDNVSIAVFDISGRKVSAIINQEHIKSGKHSIFWNGTNDLGHDLENGVYFIRIYFGDGVVVKKIVKK
ncbi:MAG: hypothetical protein DRJ10_17140, partial [Bacteroidetes bacterium]